jgi:hypothetical protein
MSEERETYTATREDVPALITEVRRLREDVAALVTALDAMTEYAGERIEEYRCMYEGYSSRDAALARMDADLAAARALLAKHTPPAA